jgi:hypothetical protein
MMLSVQDLNNIYLNSSSVLQMKIVKDELLRLARISAKVVTANFENEVDPVFGILRQKIWRVFPEIYNNPLRSSENKRLSNLLEDAVQEMANIEKSINGSNLLELKNLQKFFQQLNLRDSSPFYKELENILDTINLSNSYKRKLSQENDFVVIVNSLRTKTIMNDKIRSAYPDAMVKVQVPREFQGEGLRTKSVIFLGPSFENSTIDLVINSAVVDEVFCISHFNYIQRFGGFFENSYKSHNREIRVENREYAMSFDEAYSTSQILVIDFDQEMGYQNQTDSSVDEIIDCRIMRFQDGKYALFPNEDILDESEYVEMLSEDDIGQNIVSRVLIEDLDSDSIILMRAGATSTNSIVPEADKIMGAQARIHRQQQNNWKNRLIEVLKTNGHDNVVRSLKQLGISRPYVRNWSREHLIRPLYDETFDKLLTFLGFSDLEKSSIFHSARVIRGAHQRAGAEITKSLKSAFSDIRLSSIYEQGSFSIKLSGDEEVMVVALIFETLDESIVKARLSQTRRLLYEKSLN